ncbi:MULTISPECIES: hypothetical protein [Pseudomonas]|uniref:Uncharacterized protein n=1 Tax=Pseudomonas putida TaxID=303 RepID=A0A7V8J0R6_PSEPU|nr:MULTISPECIES: hypothetical protein [Pseudomonas]KAF0250636.1 hypothetical protein GN299_32890 [Pseudomonas putida]WOB57087.1 hypothetical protein NY023_17840 [Pseudomonas sp. NBB]
MYSSKHRNTEVSFEASTSFNLPEGLEEYRAIVKLETSGLINTWFDDFRVAYTLIQAVQVATSLSHSLVHLAKHRRSVEEEHKLAHRVACWSDLIAPYMSKPQPGSDQLYWGGSGADFVASGAFRDPDPIVEFCDNNDAIYDFAISLEGGSVSIRFGRVAWMLSSSEAGWLAEQVWAATLLAAQQARCLS